MGSFLHTQLSLCQACQLNNKDFLKHSGDRRCNTKQSATFMFTWIGSIVAILTTIAALLVTIGLSNLVNNFGEYNLFARCARYNSCNSYSLNNHIQKLNIEN